MQTGKPFDLQQLSGMFQAITVSVGSSKSKDSGVNQLRHSPCVYVVFIEKCDSSDQMGNPQAFRGVVLSISIWRFVKSDLKRKVNLNFLYNTLEVKQTFQFFTVYKHPALLVHHLFFIKTMWCFIMSNGSIMIHRFCSSPKGLWTTVLTYFFGLSMTKVKSFDYFSWPHVLTWTYIKCT